MAYCITDGIDPRGGAGEYTRDTKAYWEMRHAWDRKPFQPFWNDALKLLRERRFKTQMEFAGYFKKPPQFATAFKALVIKQCVMSVDEWKNCFSRDKRGRPTEDPRSWEEQQARVKQAEEDIPLLDKASGFATDDGYHETVGAVMARLVSKEFKNEEALQRFFKVDADTVERFRNMIVGGELVSEDEYQGLFVRFTRRRVVDMPSSWSELSLEALRPLLQRKKKVEGTVSLQKRF